MYKKNEIEKNIDDIQEEFDNTALLSMDFPDVDSMISRSKKTLKPNLKEIMSNGEFHITNVDKYLNEKISKFIEIINKPNVMIISDEENFDLDEWSEEIVYGLNFDIQALHFVIYKDIKLNGKTTYNQIKQIINKLHFANEDTLFLVKKHYWEKHYLNRYRKCIE